MGYNISDIFVIIATLATIVGAIAAIVVVRQKHLRYALLVTIAAIAISLCAVIFFGYYHSASSSDKYKKPAPELPPFVDPSKIVSSNRQADSVKAKATNANATILTGRSQSHHEYKSGELTLGGRVVADGFVYELNLCKRYNDTVACDITIESFGFEDKRVWVSSDDTELPERNLTDSYTYLLDSKGVKHTWPELRPTSPGGSVFEGPTLDCEFTKDRNTINFSLGFKGIDKSVTYIKKLNLGVELHTLIKTIPTKVYFSGILIR